MDACSQRLPPELIHHVLENLDKPSLAAFALTSHGMLVMTRPYLFSEVVWMFPHNTPSHRTSPAPGQDRRDLPGQFPLVAEFLESHHDIASHIRHVQLNLGEDSDTYNVFEMFLRILRRLTGIRNLTLNGIPGLPHHPIQLDNSSWNRYLRTNIGNIPLIPSLRTLKVQHFLQRRAGDINYILCLFGSIERLIFVSYYGDAEEHEYIPGLPYPRLGLLELRDSTVYSIAHSLPKQQRGEIRRLYLAFPRSDNLDNEQDIVKDLSGSLQHLHLACIDADSNPFPLMAWDNFAFTIAHGSFDLSIATSLQSVVFPLLVYHVSQDERHGGVTGDTSTTLFSQELYECIVHTLATAPRSLQTVAIELSVVRLPHDWKSRIGPWLPGMVRTLKPPLESVRHMRELEEACARRPLEIRARPGEIVSERDKQWFGEALATLLGRGALRFL